MKQARVLANLFECIARGFELRDVLKNEKTVREYENEFAKLVASLNFFKSKLASSRWGPMFRKKLGQTLSVVPAHVSEEAKSFIRGSNPSVCFGCGSREHNNMKAVSMFGCLPCEDDDSRKYFAFQDVGCLESDYAQFYDGFCDVLNMKPTRELARSVHPHEGGMVVLGDTCHNRALAYNVAENFVLNFIYLADQFIQECEAGGHKIKPDKFYVSLESDAVRINQSFLMIQEWAARETQEISQDALCNVANYIDAMRKLRNASFLDKTMSISDRSRAFYGILGMIGSKPWGHYDQTNELLQAYMKRADPDSADEADKQADKAASAPTLIDALRKHVAGAASTSNANSAGSKAASKRPLSEAQSSTPPGPSTEDAHASKRSKLVDHLEKIKDRLKKSGHLADALAVMEAVAELQK